MRCHLVFLSLFSSYGKTRIPYGWFRVWNFVSYGIPYRRFDILVLRSYGIIQNQYRRFGVLVLRSYGIIQNPYRWFPLLCILHYTMDTNSVQVFFPPYRGLFRTEYRRFRTSEWYIYYCPIYPISSSVCGMTFSDTNMDKIGKIGRNRVTSLMWPYKYTPAVTFPPTTEDYSFPVTGLYLTTIPYF